MRWFFLGFLLISSGAVAALDFYLARTEYEPIWMDAGWFRTRMLVYLVVFGFIPAIGAGGGAMVLQGARPMRLFTQKKSRRFAKYAIGSFAGLISVICIIILISAADGHVPDALVTAGSGTFAGVLVPLVFCAKERLGQCIGCGYDLRGSRRSGHCPECGRPCGPDYPVAASAGG